VPGCFFAVCWVMSKKVANNQIYSVIKTLLMESKQKVYKSINSTMVNTYWNIGRIIVEEEQKGQNKAKYGEYLLRVSVRKADQGFWEGVF